MLKFAMLFMNIAAVLFAGVANAGTYTFQTFDVDGATGGTSIAGINDSGQLSGYYYDATGPHGFIFSDGTLDRVTHQGNQTIMMGINNHGDAVGYACSGGHCQSFIYSNQQFLGLSYPSAVDTYATGINDAGVVVGRYSPPGPHTEYGFTYDSGVFTQVRVDASSITALWGINNENAIVGNGLWAGASLIQDGAVTSILDTSTNYGTYIFGINDHGQVVGRTGGGAVFVYDGTFSYVNIPDYMTGVSVFDINNWGQIVGTYWDGSGSHGFIASLSDVPEPAGLSLMMIALAGLGAAKRLKKKAL